MYAEPIGVLRRLTEQRLSVASATDEYVDLLGALLSFEGVEVWDRCLEGLSLGEYEVDCPHCGVNAFVVLGADGGYSCTDDYALGEVERTPLRPVEPGELGDLARRLRDRAVADGQDGVAGDLLRLFGRADCPDCGTEFLVADRVVAGWVAP